jgi:3-phenylpropionate/trans-cinnamate dioxygenase ferredoxin reductase subunit
VPKVTYVAHDGETTMVEGNVGDSSCPTGSAALPWASRSIGTDVAPASSNAGPRCVEWAHSESDMRAARIQTDVLIVGACQAGLQLATSLREDGYAGKVTLVSEEMHPPYQRPPLSKAALVEALEVETLHFRSAAFYAAQDIDLLLDSRIVSAAVGADGGGEAVTDAGRVIEFGRLALTVGATARRLNIPGADSEGIYYLRDINDSSRLREALKPGEKVLVVGGGFIGLEVAASATQLGCEVTVVLADDRLMARAVGGIISDLFLAVHRERGVKVYLATTPLRVVSDQTRHVRAVELSNGAELEADVVVVGIGAVPRTELADAMGLAVDNGIIVDRYGVTSDGHTVAAGDCVNCPNPLVELAGPSRVRFESVSTAVEQAKVAASAITGRNASYSAVPWFWSHQFDLKLQAAGLPDSATHHVVRGDIAAEKLTVLHYASDRLVAVESVNSPADFLTARNAITAGRTIDRAAALDVTQPLKLAVREVTDSDESMAS